MVIRVVSYAVKDIELAREWSRTHGPEVRGAPGVREAYFTTRDDPPQIGAIQVFNSPEDMRRYKESHRFAELVRSLRGTLGPETETLIDEVYQVVEV